MDKFIEEKSRAKRDKLKVNITKKSYNKRDTRDRKNCVVENTSYSVTGINELVTTVFEGLQSLAPQASCLPAGFRELRCPETGVLYGIAPPTYPTQQGCPRGMVCPVAGQVCPSGCPYVSNNCPMNDEYSGDGMSSSDDTDSSSYKRSMAKHLKEQLEDCESTSNEESDCDCSDCDDVSDVSNNEEEGDHCVDCGAFVSKEEQQKIKDVHDKYPLSSGSPEPSKSILDRLFSGFPITITKNNEFVQASSQLMKKHGEHHGKKDEKFDSLVKQLVDTVGNGPPMACIANVLSDGFYNTCPNWNEARDSMEKIYKEFAEMLPLFQAGLESKVIPRDYTECVGCLFITILRCSQEDITVHLVERMLEHSQAVFKKIPITTNDIKTMSPLCRQLRNHDYRQRISDLTCHLGECHHDNMRKVLIQIFEMIPNCGYDHEIRTQIKSHIDKLSWVTEVLKNPRSNLHPLCLEQHRCALELYKFLYQPTLKFNALDCNQLRDIAELIKKSTDSYNVKDGYKFRCVPDINNIVRELRKEQNQPTSVQPVEEDAYTRLIPESLRSVVNSINFGELADIFLQPTGLTNESTSSKILKSIYSVLGADSEVDDVYVMATGLTEKCFNLSEEEYEKIKPEIRTLVDKQEKVLNRTDIAEATRSHIECEHKRFKQMLSMKASEVTPNWVANHLVGDLKQTLNSISPCAEAVISPGLDMLMNSFGFSSLSDVKGKKEENESENKTDEPKKQNKKEETTFTYSSPPEEPEWLSNIVNIMLQSTGGIPEATQEKKEEKETETKGKQESDNNVNNLVKDVFDILQSASSSSSSSTSKKDAKEDEELSDETKQKVKDLSLNYILNPCIDTITSIVSDDKGLNVDGEKLKRTARDSFKHVGTDKDPGFASFLTEFVPKLFSSIKFDSKGKDAQFDVIANTVVDSAVNMATGKDTNTDFSDKMLSCLMGMMMNGSTPAETPKESEPESTPEVTTSTSELLNKLASEMKDFQTPPPTPTEEPKDDAKKRAEGMNMMIGIVESIAKSNPQCTLDFAGMKDFVASFSEETDKEQTDYGLLFGKLGKVVTNIALGTCKPTNTAEEETKRVLKKETIETMFSKLGDTIQSFQSKDGESSTSESTMIEKAKDMVDVFAPIMSDDNGQTTNMVKQWIDTTVPSFHLADDTPIDFGAVVSKTVTMINGLKTQEERDRELKEEQGLQILDKMFREDKTFDEAKTEVLQQYNRVTEALNKADKEREEREEREKEKKEEPVTQLYHYEQKPKEESKDKEESQSGSGIMNTLNKAVEAVRAANALHGEADPETLEEKGRDYVSSVGNMIDSFDGVDSQVKGQLKDYIANVTDIMNKPPGTDIDPMQLLNTTVNTMRDIYSSLGSGSASSSSSETYDSDVVLIKDEEDDSDYSCSEEEVKQFMEC